MFFSDWAPTGVLESADVAMSWFLKSDSSKAPAAAAVDPIRLEGFKTRQSDPLSITLMSCLTPPPLWWDCQPCISS